MVKSGLFTKSFANGIDAQFSRGSTENKMPEEPYYDITLTRLETKLSLRIKKNASGFWGIEDRTHLPSWARDLEPEFIRVVKQNES